MFSRFEKKDEFIVIGKEVTSRYETVKETIGPAIHEFVRRSGEVKNTVNRKLEYGVALRDGKEDFTYLYGLEVTSAEDVPPGMVAHTIPAQEYAVLVHKGSMENFGDIFTYFYSTWLPENGYERPMTPFFEVYGEQFIHEGPNIDESIMEVYMPVQKKAETVGAE